MSVAARITRYRSLQREHAAWRLLRAATAPSILGFLGGAFDQQREIPIAEVRAMLNAHITDWFAPSEDSAINAQGLLTRWVKEGYIREQEGHYLMTDACEQALRFLDGMEKRHIAATATHLRQVQEAVESVVLRASEDTAQRAKILDDRIAELERQKRDLEAGNVEPMSPQEQRESVRNVYHLSQQLTGDFRFMDEEYRQSGRDLREQMMSDDQSRGDILERALDFEQELARTPAGQAFDGFYRLLADEENRMGFRGLLRELLQTSAATHLDPQERKFLKNLVGELTQESNRVLERRARNAQALSGFVKSGGIKERRAIDDALAAVTSAALALRAQKAPVSATSELPITVTTGGAHSWTPDALRVDMPVDTTFSTDFVESRPEDGISSGQIDRMSVFELRRLTGRIQEAMGNTTQATVAELSALMPFQQGLEEVIGAFRIATAIGAEELPGMERLRFSDRHGQQFEAEVPRVLLRRDAFPDDPKDLPI